MQKKMAQSGGRFAIEYLLLSVAFAVATLILLWVALYGIARLSDEAADTGSEGIEAPEFCIVLDAGHGGEDGGAVGVDGLLEKTVNLQIAEMLRDQLTLAEIPVLMTRSDDRLLYDPQADYQGRKKMLDLRARLDIVRNTPGAVLISIHLNAFTQSKYSGLQVYYSENHPNSRQLAERIQEAVHRYLQPDNNRKTKPADSSIYLLNRSEQPAVLVECGFLSNPDECARLGDAGYIGELSTVLFGAICDYLTTCNGGA